MYLWLLTSILFIWCAHASDTDLLSVLSAQPSLTKFTSFIRGYSDILAAAQAQSVTVIAPNDDAFDAFFASPGPTGNYSTSDQLHALIQYHILKGAHTSFSITSTPSFLPSILTNTTYTNVTAGQAAEAVRTNETSITFHSAVKQVSTVLVLDLVFLQGYIHIVDTVMIPPVDVLTTVAVYPLTYAIQGLSTVLNDNYTEVVKNITNTPDQTYFLANDKSLAELLANNTQYLNEALVMATIDYMIVPGKIAYSTDLVNGSEWLTALGENLTITELDGDFYVDDAKIIIKDLLVADGVLHITNKYLNSSFPDARPQLNNTVASSNNATTDGSNFVKSPRESLSTGAKAGIGVGVVVAGFILSAIVVMTLRRRRGRNTADRGRIASNRSLFDSAQEINDHAVHEKDSPRLRHELQTKSRQAVELHAETRAQELDGMARTLTSRSTTEDSVSHSTEDRTQRGSEQERQL